MSTGSTSPLDTERTESGQASGPPPETTLQSESPDRDTENEGAPLAGDDGTPEASDTVRTRASSQPQDPERLERWISSLEPRFVCQVKHSSTLASWVYRGTDIASGKSVAIKLLRDSQRSARNAFIAEALLLSELEHPGIVRYIAHGELSDGGAYIVTEWLEGEDVSALIRRGRLSPAEGVTLVTRAAHVLAAAHGRGIVHLDIKPSNLFLARKDLADIWLLDFGIARLTRSVVSDPGEDAVAGTPGYMAPEQILGENVSPATDVFALGCVLFASISGRRIFEGNSSEVMTRTVEAPIPRVSSLASGVPPALDDLIASLLRFDPKQRPADANAVLAALASLPAEFLEELAPSARILLKPRGLSAAERVPTTVVLVRHASSDQAASDVEGRGRYSSFFEALADGTWLALPRGNANSLDQAVHAARLTLDVREQWPRAAVAIVAGHTVGRATAPQLHELLTEAERLVERASPGQILLDAASASLIESEFGVLPLDASTLQLCQPRAVSPSDAAKQGEPLCLGRETELAALLSAAKDALSAPHARAVLLTGPAGIGKSNLLREFFVRLHGLGFVTARWSAYGDPMSAGSALRLVRSLLDTAAASGVSNLARLLASESSETLELEAAKPAGSVDDVHRAFAQLVSEELEKGPLVVQLEDIHWADLGSLRAIDFVLATLTDRPLLVVATARPEVRDLFPDLWQRRSVQEIRLGDLAEDAANRLITLQLGADISPDARGRIVQRARGNAFLLHELISAQAEGRGDEMSETALGIAQSRLLVLTPDARRVLRAASVLGDPFAAQGVAFLLGDSAALADVERWLDWLASREIIRRRDAGASDAPALTFAHALMRDAAYEMLTDSDRKLGHGLAAQWLESAERPNALVTAQHYALAGDGVGAGRWYLRATLEAFKIGDFSATAASAEQALGQDLSPHERGHAQAVAAHAYRLLGNVEKSKLLSAEALRALPPNTPLWRQAARTAMMAGASGGKHRHG